MPLTLTTPWTPEMKERAIRNVAWVKANMQSIVAMAAPPQETFADKLTKATKTLAARRPRGTVIASAYPPAEESFADKLKKAVERRTGAKQKAEQAERYRPFKRRQRTKGE